MDDGSYNCNEMGDQVADHGVDNLCFCDRFHIRFWGIPATFGTNNVKSVGDAHHEDWVWSCGLVGGHAVDANGPEGSGFDQGRRELRIAFNQYSQYHFDVDVQDWGNTNNFKQCDGQWAGSSGLGVRVLNVPQL